MKATLLHGWYAPADARQKTLVPSSNLAQTNLVHVGVQFASQSSGAKARERLGAELSAILHLSPSQQTTVLESVQAGKKLKLPKGYGLEYGFIFPDGHIESPYPALKSMLQPWLNQVQKQGRLPKSPQPVLLTLETPETSQSLKKLIDDGLKKDFAQIYRNPKTGIVTNNVILTDLVEKLISGHANTELPRPVIAKINRALSGAEPNDSGLAQLYKIQVPGKPDLTREINRNPKARQQLLGLDLAQKIYAESQDIEWQSIALSLALGVTGEPTINHFFKDGGSAATVIRTGLMSAIDIAGNVLSVMGVVNENLKSRSKNLSFETLYGPKEKRNLLKTLFNPQGEAGPDIKHGVKAGLLGGLFGVWFNVPAGGILSMPHADVASRSVIGGLGAAGSAVAIPFAIRDAKENFKSSIRLLIEKEKIQPPKSIRNNPAKLEKYIEKMALKELNVRIGMASSIKATHPIPLIGTGTMLLAGEKLGIPREYVQTAYMALAPVMHNFLRLVYTGVEKFWTIPARMRKLEKLVSESQRETDRQFNPKQLEQMDKAFLSGQDQWLSQGITNFGAFFAVGTVLLAAEVLYFMKAFQSEKAQKQAAKMTANAPRNPALAFKLTPSPYISIQTPFQAPYGMPYGYQPMSQQLSPFYYNQPFSNLTR